MKARIAQILGFCVVRTLAFSLCVAFGVHGANYLDKRKSAESAANALFSGEVIPDLKIDIDRDGLNVLRENSSNRYNAPNRPNALATVREGTNIFRSVAVHLKGSAGSFRGIDDEKPAFTLHFDHVLPDQRFHGLKKIHLNNSVQDPTFMCEILGREIFNVTSVPAPRAGHALVTLNGEALGLFVLVEGADKQFLKRHFPDVHGNFYEGAFRDDITSPLEVKCGDHPENRLDLDALVAATRLSDLDQRFAAMARVLDADRFATFLALEVLLGHWDGYSLHQNNYRIFHDNSSGRLIFIPHGMDQLFGLRGRGMDPSILPTMSGLAAASFMETPAGRRLYLDRISELHTNVFKVAALTARVDKLAAVLRPILHSDWEFDSRVALLKSRLASRSEEIAGQLSAMKVAFDERGEANLSRVPFDLGRDFFRGGRGRWRGDSPRALPEPRAVVLLEPGRYRFQVRVRAEVEGHAVAPGAVALSSSAGRGLRRLPSADGWAVLEHEFTLTQRDYVVLKYQLESPDGLAAFDKSSLKLIRSAGGPPPSSKKAGSSGR